MTNTFFVKENYRTLIKVAETSSSELFSAISNASNKKVIIKVPRIVEPLKEPYFLAILKDIAGVPQILDSRNSQILIMEKLTISLKTLINQKRKLSLGTVTMLGLKLLTILQQIHNMNILHRDIKPDNIMIGENNQIFLIDYDLSKEYVRNGNHIKFKQSKAKFKGTLMFASRNALLGCSTSRRDDLESLGYTLVYLFKGFLPWSDQTFIDLGTLAKKKNDLFDEGIFEDLPSEFKKFFEYVGLIRFDETPDYEYLKGILVNLAERMQFDLGNSQWEWEKKEENSKELNQEFRKQENSENIVENDLRKNPLRDKFLKKNLKNGFNEVFKKLFE